LQHEISTRIELADIDVDIRHEPRWATAARSRELGRVGYGASLALEGVA
jgi:hypothetical protein